MLRTSLLATIAGLTLAAVVAPAAPAATDTFSRLAGGPGSIAAPQDALQIGLSYPEGVAAEAGGTTLIADSFQNRILRVGTDGIARIVAGGGSSTADGIQATSARVAHPTDVAALPGGAFLFVEALGNRVRKVTADGVVTTVAGDGSLRTDGDAGAATSAGLYYPWSVAVMPDGGFVVSQPYAYKVRRVYPDGSIRTILGDGAAHYDENVPGTQTGSNYPYGLAVKQDGSVLVAEDWGAKVRRVRPDGIVERFAGSGTDMGAGISQGSEDGKDAKTVGLGRLCDITVAADDSVYFTQSDCGMYPQEEATNRYYLIGRVSPDGRYSVFAGNGFGVYQSQQIQGAHRRAVGIGRGRGLAMAPGGDILFVENQRVAVWRLDTDITAPVPPPGDGGGQTGGGTSGEGTGAGAGSGTTAGAGTTAGTGTPAGGPGPGGTTPGRTGASSGPRASTTSATRAAVILATKAVKARRARAFRIALKAGRPAAVKVEIRRGRRTVSRRTLRVRRGATGITLTAPAARGAYTIRLGVDGAAPKTIRLTVR